MNLASSQHTFHGITQKPLYVLKLHCILIIIFFWKKKKREQNLKNEEKLTDYRYFFSYIIATSFLVYN